MIMARLILFLLSLTSTLSSCFQLQGPFTFPDANVISPRERLEDLEEQRSQLTLTVDNLSRSVDNLQAEVEATSTTGCPQDFVLNKDINFCYKISPKFQRGTFQLAHAMCHALHEGRIAIFPNAEKFQFIRSILTQDSKEACFWVGAERDSNGLFSTWHDGTKIPSEFWGPGEPSRKQEKCAQLHTQYQYKMNDIACSTSCGFVCEVPLM